MPHAEGCRAVTVTPQYFRDCSGVFVPDGIVTRVAAGTLCNTEPDAMVVTAAQQRCPCGEHWDVLLKLM